MPSGACECELEGTAVRIPAFCVVILPRVGAAEAFGWARLLLLPGLRFLVLALLARFKEAVKDPHSVAIPLSGQSVFSPVPLDC